VSATAQELVLDRQDLRSRSQHAPMPAPPVRLFVLLTVIWVLGIGVMWSVSSVSREFRPFSISVIVVALISVALWQVVIRRYEPSIALLPIMAILLVKISLSYISWTGFVLGPGPNCEPKDIATSDFKSDILSAIEAVKSADLYWQDVGFEIPIPESYYLPTNHRVPVYLLALPLRFISGYPEASIPWNALYSLLTATSVLGIATLMSLSGRTRNYVFLFAFLVPFTWLTGGLYKDILLQAVLCTFVLATMSLRRHLIVNGIVILAGSALLYQFRAPYFLLAITIGAYVVFEMENRRKVVVATALGLALLTIASQTALKDRYFVGVRDQYADTTPETQPFHFAGGGPASLVKRGVVGLMTPFPWDRAFAEPRLFHAQIAEYAQVTLTLALLTLIVPLIVSQLRDGIMPPPPTVMAILFMIIGMSGPAIHHGYVQVGSVLLLPQGLSLGHNRLFQRCQYCLIGLLWVNILWISGARAIWGAQS